MNTIEIDSILKVTELQDHWADDVIRGNGYELGSLPEDYDFQGVN
jgi:hypothetical protein